MLKMDKNVVSGVADQLAEVILTVSVYKLQTKVLIWFKRGFNLHLSSYRSFSFHHVDSKPGAAIFTLPKNTNKSTTKINYIINYPFLLFLNH